MEQISIKPLSEKTWPDFEKLFGPKGACGGCWCMTYRLKSKDYEKLKGDGNRKKMKHLVKQGKLTGIIGYLEDEPIAWCSISPREEYVRLENSRILSRIDEKPVWSIVCFFIHKNNRRQGFSEKLILKAVDIAGQLGAKIIEAYPIIPKKKEVPPVFAFNGLASSFIKCGFQEVARRSETRPIMRLKIKST